MTALYILYYPNARTWVNAIDAQDLQIPFGDFTDSMIN